MKYIARAVPRSFVFLAFFLICFVIASPVWAVSATTTTAVNPADTSTTVTSSLNPSVFGQPVTFTANVAVVAPGVGTATGTVTFLDNGNPIGTATLSGGIAIFATSALTVLPGPHTITTSYGGDGNFNGSTGSLTGNPQVVNRADTSSTVTSSSNPSVSGQSVTFTATVSLVPPAPAPGTTGSLVGTVTDASTATPILGARVSYNGGSTITNASGQYAFSSTVAAGTYTITAGESGFVSQSQDVTVSAGATAILDFKLTASTTPAGAITGKVTDASSLAVSGVTVSYFGGSTTTDTNGNYTLSGVTPDTYAVTVASNGLLASSTQAATVTSGATTTADFTLVDAPVATGTVTFLDGGSPIGTGTLSGGIATFTTSALTGGNHTITTSYGGDFNVNGSTGSLTGNPQVVNKSDTTTTVTSSANPSVFGQSVTFTATVSPMAPGGGLPTGTVIFLDGGSPIGTATLSGGIATFTSSALAVGSHTITTTYAGDGNFNGSPGSLDTNPQVVNEDFSATTLTSSANPSVFGQTVTFTATVSAVVPGSGTPTGSVVFSDNGSAIIGCGAAGLVPLIGGIAACTTSTLTLGNHTITTTYGGDAHFTGSPGSLNTNPQVVNQAATTTTVSPSAATITLGDTVTFTATVTVNPPASGTPTGLVTFFDGTTPMANQILTAGQATFSTAVLAVGSHSITAVYLGDANFNASLPSAATIETVNLRGSTTSLVLNPTTVGAGQASTTTVTVTDTGSSTPPGTPDVFSATGAPATGRAGFTATLFTDGGVVIIGGTDANGVVLNSAEVYFGGVFSSVPGALNTDRTGAVAVLLGNGKVLVAGGSSNGSANGALNSAELLDLRTGTFAPTGQNMKAARFGGTATLLGNGKVLLAGGINSGGVLNSAELYDPAADTFTATGNLNTARAGHSATLLGTGQVLIAGGSSDGAATGALNSGELFDPAGGAFTAITGANSTLSDFRWQPEAALLLSGKVLIAGGANSPGAVSVLATADLYDPVANTFTATAHVMNAARANGSAVALPNGMVLLPGGTASETVDLYDPEGDKFYTTGGLQHSDNGLVATLGNNGQVLVVGINTDNAPNLVSDAELYSPSFNPLGTIGLGSSDVTDVFGAPCVLTPVNATASTCTSAVTPVEVGTSPHTITATYPVDNVHAGTSSTASLTVIPIAPPTIAKAFSASNVGQNSTVNVSFTIVNPDPASTLTGISFTDSLPAGLVVATPNNLNSNCGGTFTAVPGSSALSLAGGTLGPPPPPPELPRKNASRSQSVSTAAASGQCVITVDLQVTGTGTIRNTTGAISANESGPGNPSNTVSIEVVQAPTVNKAFGAASIPVNGTTSLTFNIANPNTAIALDGVALTDTLPSGLVVANPNGLTGSCVASSSISATGNSISLFNLNLVPSASCSFSVNVTGTSAGTKNNATNPISATFDDGSGTFRIVTGGTASASLVVVAPPVISKAFVPPSIAPNGLSALTFTITNPSANTVAETGVGFTDNLPANLVVATPNGVSGSCGGTVTATAGSASISLSGGSIATGGSCVFSVNVTSSVLGSYTNTTGAVSSTNGGTGNTASATLTVANAVLSITKTHQGAFTAGQTGANWIITVSASAAAGPTDGSTVTVTDTLPNVTNPPVPTAIGGTGWTCTLATLTCTRNDALASGASYPAITLTVNIPKAIVNQFTNTAAVSGGGDANSHAASDTVRLGPPLVISSTDSGSVSVTHGGSALFHFQVDASGVNGLPIVVAFSCSGLPANSSCIFTLPDGSPAFAGGFSITQPITQINMTVTTLGNSALLRGRGMPPTYAALLFPAGLVGIGLAGRKRKKLRLRLAMLLMGMLILAGFAGCGGNGHVTPAGQSTITVTGSAQTAQGTVTATTTVTLNVQ